MNEGFPDFDLYEELDVSANASAEVIQAAYRRLARKYHPDSSSEPDAARMVRLNAAFEILSRAEHRRVRHLAGRNAACGYAWPHLGI